MASILDILNTQAGQSLINTASNRTSEKKEDVVSALGMALPLLLGAMKNNSKSPEGAAKLNEALSQDKHNGALFNQLNDLDPENLQNEGKKIVSHIFGENEENISSSLSAISNIKPENLSAIIKMAAPILLSILGSQKRKDNVGADGLDDLLGNILGSNSKHDNSFLETILDRDGDGNIIDDIGGMILGGNRSGRSGGSILGGFTGGK
ncbi:DUF937 domain-containing protein [Gramella lutea]|uniref:DUF937 domain-containing protein n=1 Tax=Christiangramia lutea TaxID=1607951 RepID=A0A9X1V5D1_9FLAO|nr:DUF937 domain-containing protein [Christiangramia lutea]MCH4822983.1 DUF937 domain-containing protein [Christiangramia lutea]